MSTWCLRKDENWNPTTLTRTYHRMFLFTRDRWLSSPCFCTYHCDIVNHNYRFLIVRVCGECKRVTDEHEMNYPGAGPTEIMYSFADLVFIIIITSVFGYGRNAFQTCSSTGERPYLQHISSTNLQWTQTLDTINIAAEVIHFFFVLRSKNHATNKYVDIRFSLLIAYYTHS